MCISVSCMSSSAQKDSCDSVPQHITVRLITRSNRSSWIDKIVSISFSSSPFFRCCCCCCSSFAAGTIQSKKKWHTIICNGYLANGFQAREITNVDRDRVKESKKEVEKEMYIVESCILLLPSCLFVCRANVCQSQRSNERRFMRFTWMENRLFK